MKPVYVHAINMYLISFEITVYWNASPLLIWKLTRWVSRDYFTLYLYNTCFMWTQKYRTDRVMQTLEIPELYDWNKRTMTWYSWLNMCVAMNQQLYFNFLVVALNSQKHSLLPNNLVSFCHLSHTHLWKKHFFHELWILLQCLHDNPSKSVHLMPRHMHYVTIQRIH